MPLEEQRIILVEYEWLIASDLELMISKAGGEVVGIATSLSKAMALADDKFISAAVMDFRLGWENSLPLAEKLSDCGVPFIFYTADGFGPLSKIWPHTPIVQKPACGPTLIGALETVLSNRGIPIHCKYVDAFAT
ncbi:MAG: hypothetical protein WCD20_21440 [Rhodomicrobium sp.]